MYFTFLRVSLLAENPTYRLVLRSIIVISSSYVFEMVAAIGRSRTFVVIPFGFNTVLYN